MKVVISLGRWFVPVLDFLHARIVSPTSLGRLCRLHILATLTRCRSVRPEIRSPEEREILPFLLTSWDVPIYRNFLPRHILRKNSHGKRERGRSLFSNSYQKTYFIAYAKRDVAVVTIVLVPGTVITVDIPFKCRLGANLGTRPEIAAIRKL